MSPKKKHEEQEIDIDALESPRGMDYDATDDEAGDLDGALTKIKKLKAELAACKAEKQEYLDGWQRLKADVVNGRKTEEERSKRTRTAAQEAIIGEIIPVVDSFDMARAGKGWESVDPAWKRGIDHIFSQLEGVLANAGATRFGKVGEKFNPFIHEAVKEVAPKNVSEDGTIVAILRSGWKMGELVIRPAQVTIAHSGSEQGELSSNQ